MLNNIKSFLIAFLLAVAFISISSYAKHGPDLNQDASKLVVEMNNSKQQN